MVKIRRSLLFVPADRPERIAKAASLPADVIVIELEDGVSPEQKHAARTEAGKALSAIDFGRREVMVRVNRINTRFGLLDMAAMATWPTKPDAIMIPKAESAAEVQIYAALLTEMRAECDIAALVETGRGLTEAAAIATASPRVSALVFGGADLSADLRCHFDWEALYAHRSRVVVAAAAAQSGVQVIDVPYPDIQDPDGLAAETVRVRNMGFSGKICIHPSQVEPVNQAFAPSPEELARARQVVAAAAAQGTGAIVVDGKMVDGPFVKRAHQIVALGDRLGM